MTSCPARRRTRLALAPLLLLLLGACASTPKVTRTDVDETIDLSGRWNDSDSRMVSEEMVSDALSRPWVEDHRTRAGQKPRVIVGTVRNESHEHIPVETFTKDLERELVNSGQVSFVADSGQRQEVRDERRDQASHSTVDTMKGFGKELGADYMLQGQINTIIDAAGGDQVRFYQVELEMIDIETNEKVWIGQKKLKKLVERRRFGL